MIFMEKLQKNPAYHLKRNFEDICQESEGPVAIEKKRLIAARERDWGTDLQLNLSNSADDGDGGKTGVEAEEVDFLALSLAHPMSQNRVEPSKMEEDAAKTEIYPFLSKGKKQIGCSAALGQVL